jgi:hypothetical protein
MERVNLRIRIPLIYSCMTEDCTELTKVSFCEACFKDILKPRKPKSEEKQSGLKVQSTLREGFVSIQRRNSTCDLRG